jgi:hypothetical protein
MDLAAAGRHQLEERLAGGGLAAAGLTHQGQGFACGHLQGNPVHRLHMPHHAPEQTLADRKVHLQGGDIENLAGFGRADFRRGGPRRRLHPAHAPVGIIKMAAHRLPPHPVQGRWRAPAMVLDLRATLGKTATLLALAETGHLPDDGLQGPAALGRGGQGREQLAGIGMQRLAEEVFPVAGFHQFAGVHDPHPVGHARHHAQVVGDQQHAHAAARLEIGQQIEHLGLDGHVEGRGGLVGDQQAGVARQGDGDHHPLLHATRQLEGVFGQAPPGVGNAHRIEQALGFVPGRLAMQAPVTDQHFTDLVADGHHRIEAGGRLLEDHRQVLAADVAHAGFRQILQGFARQG